MKTLLTYIFVLLAPICRADDGAVDAAKAHLSNNLKGAYKVLARTYAPKVTLMPGHEFLKPEYGLAGVPGRTQAADVDRDRLIAAMEKAAAARPERPADRIEGLLKSLKYETIETQEGDVEVAPSDPIGTPDKKLHFQVKKGDVLLRVSPPKGDFLLLHLRRIDGIWQVVSEYLD